MTMLFCRLWPECPVSRHVVSSRSKNHLYFVTMEAQAFSARMKSKISFSWQCDFKAHTLLLVHHYTKFMHSYTDSYALSNKYAFLPMCILVAHTHARMHARTHRYYILILNRIPANITLLFAKRRRYSDLH